MTQLDWSNDEEEVTNNHPKGHVFTVKQQNCQAYDI